MSVPSHRCVATPGYVPGVEDVGGRMPSRGFRGRVFMGLQKGDHALKEKPSGKVRERFYGTEPAQESVVRGLCGRKQSQPLLFVQLKERKPFIELAGCDTEALTQLLTGQKSGKCLGKDAQDKEEAVA